jgi:hypothetical protein
MTSSKDMAPTLLKMPTSTSELQAMMTPDKFEEFIIQGTRELIKTIHEEMKKARDLSAETRKTCDAILAKVEKQYTRLQIDYYTETKILIQEALRILKSSSPNQTKLESYHNVWINTLESYTRESGKLIGPILQVLNSICAESAYLDSKFKAYLTGAIGLTAVSLSLTGALFVHWCPAITCTLFATSTGPWVLSIAAVLTAGLALACITGCISLAELRAAYRRCLLSVQTKMTKHFPTLFNTTNQPVTADQLMDALRKALDMFEMKKEMWLDETMMSSLDRRTDQLLTRLNDDLKETM